MQTKEHALIFFVKNYIKCSEAVKMLQEAFGECTIYDEWFTNGINAYKMVVNQ